MWAQDWSETRQRIHTRIMASMGTAPTVQVAPHCQVTAEYWKCGLRHRKLRNRVMPDEYGLAAMVLPDGVDETKSAPAVVVCHGTDAVNGKYNVLDPELRPNRDCVLETGRIALAGPARDLRNHPDVEKAYLGG
jgi:hypothetical protein